MLITIIEGFHRLKFDQFFVEGEWAKKFVLFLESAIKEYHVERSVLFESLFICFKIVFSLIKNVY